MLARGLLIALSAVSLTGCGGGRREAAAECASRLLAAAIADDRPAFEAEIDRPAVREDMRRQVSELARATSLEVEGGPSDFALDRMIGPNAVRLVDGAGGALTAAPTAAQLSRLMQADGGQVCLRGDGRCQLTFARTKSGWRLVGMQAAGPRITVAAAS